MPRIRKLNPIPRQFGGVRSQATRTMFAGKPAKCECGQPATYHHENKFRSSDSCAEPICRERETAWVGNTSWSPASKKDPKRPSRNPEPSKRTFKVGNAADRERVFGGVVGIK